MTVAGKILTMGYAIFYVPLFLYVMTVLFQSNLERLRKADERIEKEVKTVEKDVGEVRDMIEDTTIMAPRSQKRRIIAKK